MSEPGQRADAPVGTLPGSRPPAAAAAGAVSGPETLRVLTESRPSSGIWLLRLAGPMDEHAIGVAREAMTRAMSARPRLVVVDLRRVTRIDNAGVVLLAAMRRHARRCGSRLSIVDRRAYTGRGHCGLAATLPVYRSVAAAIR